MGLPHCVGVVFRGGVFLGMRARGLEPELPIVCVAVFASVRAATVNVAAAPTSAFAAEHSIAVIFSRVASSHVRSTTADVESALHTTVVRLPTAVSEPAVVAEQKLGTCGDEGAHCGGTRLDKSVHVLVNEVVDGVRHVKVTRPLKGMTDDHYSFDMGKQPYMNVMGAIGYGPTFMHHKDHRRRQLVFLSTARDGTTTHAPGSGS